MARAVCLGWCLRGSAYNRTSRTAQRQTTDLQQKRIASALCYITGCSLAHLRNSHMSRIATLGLQPIA